MHRTVPFLAASFFLLPALYAQQPGSLRWRIPIGDAASSDWGVNSSPALGPDGTIYIGNGYWSGNNIPLPDRYLFSVTPDGQTNWIFSAGGNLSASPAFGPDGTIYIGSVDGSLYSVNPSGGTNWLFRTRGRIYSSAAMGADGTVYVTSVSNFVNELYSIRPNGSSNWVFHMGPIAFSGANGGRPEGDIAHAIGPVGCAVGINSIRIRIH